MKSQRFALPLFGFLVTAVVSECLAQSLTVAGHSLADAGFVNVVNFGADPSGKELCTEAIQSALTHAYENREVCLFPAGTYLVDDTLVCRQTETLHSHMIVGFSPNQGATVKLADDSPGFQKEMKPVFHFYHDNPNLDEKNDAKSHYNQTIRNLTIDLGTGNTMAIAIDHEAAQGSTIQDVKLVVRDAFAGIRGLMGSGAAIAGITIIGGEYGIYNDRSRPAPVVTGARFFDQRKAALFVSHRSPVTIVGFECRLHSGAVIEADGWGTKAVSLIDGIVNSSSTLADSEEEMLLYLKNVFVKNRAPVIRANGEVIQYSEPDWTHFRELAISGEDGTKLVNGRFVGENRVDARTVPALPKRNLVWEHWPASSFVRLYDQEMVSIKDFGAVGDGETDDTEAIQAAIDSSEKVFVPKGTYRLSKTIKLGKDTQLLGVARNLSVFIDDLEWSEENFVPMMQTVDDREAKTSLASVGFRVRGGKEGTITALSWRAGRRSVVRDVDFVRDKSVLRKRKGKQPSDHLRHVMVHLTNGGGGRWYHHWLKPRMSHHPESRYLLIDGTRQRLRFYSLCAEYAYEETTMMEIRNARNVNVFGWKTETYYQHSDERTRYATPLRIVDSSDVAIHTHDGKSEATKGEGLIEVIDSEEISITNMRRWGDNHLSEPNEFFLVREIRDGEVSGVTADQLLSLFQREKPAPSTKRKTAKPAHSK